MSAPHHPPNAGPPEGDVAGSSHAGQKRDALIETLRDASVETGHGSVIEHGRPPAPLRLAATLEQADARSLLHVDDRGQVRSPARYHLLGAVGTAGVALVALVCAFVYAQIFGAMWGAAAGLFVGSIGLRSARRRARMDRAAALIAEGRLDEAEALCRHTVTGRFVPRGLRAAAHQNLAAILARRGRFDEALLEVRTALRLRQRNLRPGIHVDLLAYSEIRLLVNLGRVAEARARLDARGEGAGTRGGDYLRLLHETAELTVEFGEGRARLDDDALWERSRRALQLTAAPHLLALCAWATAQHGDRDLSAHLLDEARDRRTPDAVATFPSLWAWIDGADAGAIGPTPARAAVEAGDAADRGLPSADRRRT